MRGSDSVEGASPPADYRYRNASRFHRLNRRIAAARPVAWFYARTLPAIDQALFRATRGRTTLTALMTNLPVVMLTTTGAGTGSLRRQPVLGLPDGEDLIVIGSNFGQRTHPGWYHNLRADPRATVMHDGHTVDVLATQLDGRERERCLELGALIYPGFAQYQRRAAPRRLGVFRLQATEASPAKRDGGQAEDAADSSPEQPGAQNRPQLVLLATVSHPEPGSEGDEPA